MRFLQSGINIYSFIRKLVIVVLLMGISGVTNAQCAMCRATVESTVTEGSVGIAAKLNTGILYLFVIPYILVSVIGVLWYRTSRKHHFRNRIFERRKADILKMK
jgi:hypothetical protein